MIKNRRGFTLLEIIAVLGVLSVIMLVSSSLIVDNAKRLKRIEQRDNRESSWTLLSKTAITSLTTIRANSFDLRTSVFAETDNVGNPLLYRPVPAVKKPDMTLFHIEDYPVYNDSFTVERRMNIQDKVNGMTQKIMGVYASRCVPLNANSFDEQGSTLTSKDLESNALNVLRDMEYRPLSFVRFNKSKNKTETYILCCSIADAIKKGEEMSPDKNCAREGTMVPRIYFVSIDSQQKVKAVTENPSPAETESVIGVGFALAFNNHQHPSYFRAKIFQQYSQCNTAINTSTKCDENRPVKILSQSRDAIDSGYSAKTMAEWRSVVLEYSGSVTSNLSKTGIIQLGN